MYKCVITIENKWEFQWTPQSGSSFTASGSNWNLEMLVFVKGGKPESPEKKPSEQRHQQQTTNSTHMTLGPGIKPGPHLWEASALTTTPSLCKSTKWVLKIYLESFNAR